MSETVSAFAAYRANGPAKTGNKNNKNKNRSPQKGKGNNKLTNVGNGRKQSAADAKNDMSSSATKNRANMETKKSKGYDPLGKDMDLLATSPNKLTKEERKKQKELRKIYGKTVDAIYKGTDSDLSLDGSALEYTVNSYGSDDDDEEEGGGDAQEDEGLEVNGGGGEDSSEEDDSAVEDDAEENEEENSSDSEEEEEAESNDSDTDAPEEHFNVSDVEEFSLEAMRAGREANAKKRKSPEQNGPIAEAKQAKTTIKATATTARRQSTAGKAKPPETAVAKRVVTNVKLEPFSPTSNIAKLNSIEEGERMFRWLINPVMLEEFYSKYWEKGVCLIKREQPKYYGHLISFELIGQMLLKNHVEYTKNLDITRYRNGKRETLNPVGRALPPAVWDQYRQGCSIRLLNPHTFLPTLYGLCATMQEYFHCLVGVNAYLTPAGTQGFAPHYDDIEAFVLQIEGKKRWRLYKPRKVSEYLPRFSSENFKQSEIGTPIFDEVLKPGDLLYFPRGTIHQATSEPDTHSLHLTLSVYQKQSYADLFERILPIMLEKAIATQIDMRRGLPLHLWQHAGLAFTENDTEERAQIQTHVRHLLTKCFTAVPVEQIIDQAVDQLAKKYQHEALPPELQAAERSRTVFGTVSQTNSEGAWVCDFDITVRTNVRLLRANILRLVEEEGQMRIYYYLDNSKEYCEYEPNFIEIERREAASVEVLIRSYPEYVSVSQLPLKSDDRKIGVVSALWERGLLMMEKPFN